MGIIIGIDQEKRTMILAYSGQEGPCRVVKWYDLILDMNITIYFRRGSYESRTWTPNESSTMREMGR